MASIRIENYHSAFTYLNFNIWMAEIWVKEMDNDDSSQK